jgi:hypothetical protein
MGDVEALAEAIANRVEAPYEVELLLRRAISRLMEEGVPKDIIDDIMTDFIDGLLKVT